MGSPRVNIQYSINEDDLLEEMNRLARRIVDLEGQLGHNIRKLDTKDPSVMWSLSYVENIQQCRDAIADVDRSLHDVEELVKSYLRHMSSDSSASEPRPDSQKVSAPALKTPSLQTLDGLLERFQAQQVDEAEEENYEIPPKATS